MGHREDRLAEALVRYAMTAALFITAPLVTLAAAKYILADDPADREPKEEVNQTVIHQNQFCFWTQCPTDVNNRK